MSNMLTEIAKALDPVAWMKGPNYDGRMMRRSESILRAITAVTAMREPTHEMLREGSDVVDVMDTFVLKTIWQRMIDEVLK